MLENNIILKNLIQIKFKLVSVKQGMTTFTHFFFLLILMMPWPSEELPVMQVGPPSYHISLAQATRMHHHKISSPNSNNEFFIKKRYYKPNFFSILYPWCHCSQFGFCFSRYSHLRIMWCKPAYWCIFNQHNVYKEFSDMKELY